MLLRFDAQPQENAVHNKSLILSPNTNAIMHSLIEHLWKCVIYIQAIQATHRKHLILFYYNTLFLLSFIFLIYAKIPPRQRFELILFHLASELLHKQADARRSRNILTPRLYSHAVFLNLFSLIFQHSNWECMLQLINYKRRSSDTGWLSA